MSENLDTSQLAECATNSARTTREMFRDLTHSPALGSVSNEHKLPDKQLAVLIKGWLRHTGRSLREDTHLALEEWYRPYRTASCSAPTCLLYFLGTDPQCTRHSANGCAVPVHFADPDLVRQVQQAGHPPIQTP